MVFGTNNIEIYLICLNYLNQRNRLKIKKLLNKHNHLNKIDIYLNRIVGSIIFIINSINNLDTLLIIIDFIFGINRCLIISAINLDKTTNDISKAYRND